MAGLLVARPAAADHVSVGVGLSTGNGTALAIGVNTGGRGPGPIIARPAPIVVAPAPVVVAQPVPVVVAQPAPIVVTPAPVVVAQPAPVVVAPASVVVAQPAPVVVAQPATVVVAQNTGYWVDVDNQVWVEGVWLEVTDAWGHRVRQRGPGHWETRHNREWRTGPRPDDHPGHGGASTHGPAHR